VNLKPTHRDAPPTEARRNDEQRWADLAGLALTIGRRIHQHGHTDPLAALLSQTEGIVMRHLLCGGSAAPSRIAAATGLLRPNVSASLRTLRDKGLIEKEANPADGRGFTVRPTALARAKYELVRRDWATAIAEAAGHDTTDLDAAIAILTKVNEGLANGRPARGCHA
jgi:DNA-binding MarR family transcriptional regulator